MVRVSSSSSHDFKYCLATHIISNISRCEKLWHLFFLISVCVCVCVCVCMSLSLVHLETNKYTFTISKWIKIYYFYYYLNLFICILHLTMWWESTIPEFKWLLDLGYFSVVLNLIWPWCLSCSGNVTSWDPGEWIVTSSMS